MRFHLPIVLAAITAAPLLAQSPPQPTTGAPSITARPSFAAVTIKPHDPNDPCHGCSGLNTEGDRITIKNKSAGSIMRVAYAIQLRQIVGAPDWFFNDTFDIAATTGTPGDLTKAAEFHAALQTLLTDRFALAFHHEQRDQPAYAIQIAKSGPKIKPASPDEKTGITDNRNGNDETLTFTNVSIADFLARLQPMIGLPLTDETGLTGHYDIALHYTISDDPSADHNAQPGLFTAIQQQLGLKLQSTKAPLDTFVIDHVNHPSPN